MPQLMQDSAAILHKKICRVVQIEMLCLTVSALYI